MYARLVLIGTGTDDDPFRADLPSYSMVSVDYSTMQVVVTFNPKDRPMPPPALGSPLYPLLEDKYVLIGLEPSALTAWYARLAARYPGHEPPFTPEFP